MKDTTSDDVLTKVLIFRFYFFDRLDEGFILIKSIDRIDIFRGLAITTIVIPCKGKGYLVTNQADGGIAASAQNYLRAADSLAFQ